MAYAAARFTDSLIKGMNGQEGVVECAYIQSDVTEATYFATPVVLGPNGVEKNLGLGTLTAYEQVNIQFARFSLQQKEYGILGHLTLAETVPTC